MEKLRFFVNAHFGVFQNVYANTRYIWAVDPDTGKSYSLFENGQIKESPHGPDLKQSLEYVRLGQWIEVVI